MFLRVKIRAPGLAVAANLDVVVFIVAVGHVRRRQVGQLREFLLQFLAKSPLFSLGRGDVVLQLLYFLDELDRLLALFLRLADIFGFFVSSL